MVYHRSANLEQSCLYTYSSNTCEAAAARCNKHPLPAQAQSPYLKFWPPFCELWLWFSFNSETFLENGSKKRRRQSGRWFSWAWRAWLDSIAVPVFAVWLNLTNTETAATTPLNLLQNLWSASAQWKVLESGGFGWISSATYINSLLRGFLRSQVRHGGDGRDFFITWPSLTIMNSGEVFSLVCTNLIDQWELCPNHYDFYYR